ncbi:MAG: diguanylate cyclase [Clostridia bacterium]
MSIPSAVFPASLCKLHEPFMSANTHPDRTQPCMDDDFFSTLLLDSQMALFDYDVFADDFVLSVMLDNGQRVTRHYETFLATLASRQSIPEELRQGVLVTAKQCCAQAGKTSFSICIDLHLSGEYRWYLAFVHSLTNTLGKVNRVIGRLRDVQAEKLTELRLQSLSLYRNAVDFASLFVYEFDLPGFKPLAAVDGKRCSKDFYPCEQYLDPNHSQLIHPESREALSKLLCEQALLCAYHERRYELALVLRILNLRSEWVWVRLTIHLSYCASTSIQAHGIIYMQTIQEQVVLEERAKHDCITGLLNRGATEEQMNDLLLNSPTAAYFFIFDVDNFKSINDTHGHAEGDFTLKQVATALREHLRQSDILGRIGGDEFVALLTGMENRAAVERKASELLTAVSETKSPAIWQGGAALSISIGIACAPEHGMSFDTLYRAADRALYLAKGAGKNQFCIMGKA